MSRFGMSLPCWVLLLQIVFASLLFFLSCQEVRASSLPERRGKRDSDAVQTNPLAAELAQHTEQERGRQLLESSQQGNLTMVQLLVQTGVNLTARTDSKLAHTALHLAAMYGHAKVVKELLRAGALNVRDNEGNLPLHYAADGGFLVYNFLFFGENHPDRWQYTALGSSVRRDYLAVVKLMLNHTADCDVRGADNITALHIAAWRGYTSIVRYMVERGCQVNIRDRLGKTPLHAAAGACHVETLRALVELGAEINVQDNGGRTPLHGAALRSNIETVRALVELGANVNGQDNRGDTPLHRAVYVKNIEIIRALVDLGAHLDVKNKSGKTPLTLARENEYTSIAMYQESRGTTV